MDAEAQIVSARKRCRIAVGIAVGAILLSMGISVPRAFQRRARLKAANEQLVTLQAQITFAQKEIRERQLKIVAVQKEINGRGRGP